MKKGRFESSASAKKHTKKVVALLLVMLLLVGSVVGTTLAWLTAKVETVTNTFTIGSVTIHLNDGQGAADDTWQNASQKVSPGVDVVDFDPYVKVDAGSEECWLFVKVEAANGPTVTLDDCWLQTSVANVYVYAEMVESVKTAKTVAAGQTDVEHAIIKNSTVDIPDNFAPGAENATVQITAYAVQAAGFANYADAWTQANFT